MKLVSNDKYNVIEFSPKLFCQFHLDVALHLHGMLDLALKVREQPCSPIQLWGTLDIWTGGGGGDPALLAGPTKSRNDISCFYYTISEAPEW